MDLVGIQWLPHSLPTVSRVALNHTQLNQYRQGYRQFELQNSPTRTEIRYRNVHVAPSCMQAGPAPGILFHLKGLRTHAMTTVHTFGVFITGAVHETGVAHGTIGLRTSHVRSRADSFERIRRRVRTEKHPLWSAKD